MAGFLPNLLIVGAAKSGTTSLHAYLDHHPEVAMSKKKELQLFSREDWRERLDWYRSQFPVEAPVRGESSPAYSMDPVLAGVPERARELIPDARIVYLVRDPVERIVPHYVEFVARGLEERPLEQALADYDSDSNVFTATSRYAHQLERWRESFPEASILVLDQCDLLSDRRATLREVFRFLGVDDSFWSPEFERLHNTQGNKLRANRRGAWLWRHGLYETVLGGAERLPRPLRARVRGLFGDEVHKPTLDPALREELRASLREDAERLRSYTGRSFDHWSV